VSQFDCGTHCGAGLAHSAVIVTARLITTISRSSDQVAPLRHPRPAFGSAALKIDLFLRQQGLDTTTPAGKAMFQIWASLPSSSGR
jgi:hypothetical protein